MSADMRFRIFEMLAIMLLFLNARKDVRDHEISLPVTCAGVIIGILCATLTRRDFPAGIFLSLLPGLVSSMLTRFTRGEIGGGDGILLCMLGLFYSAADMILILSAALFLSGMYSILLLTRHHSGRDRFAFAPFLLAGAVLLALYSG